MTLGTAKAFEANTLQHTATHCNTLQHTATHCNTLQHANLTGYQWCFAFLSQAPRSCDASHSMLSVCSLLQCVAVCCSLLQCRQKESAVQCVAMCCSMVQCVAVDSTLL